MYEAIDFFLYILIFFYEIHLCVYRPFIWISARHSSKWKIAMSPLLVFLLACLDLTNGLDLSFKKHVTHQTLISLSGLVARALARSRPARRLRPSQLTEPLNSVILVVLSSARVSKVIPHQLVFIVCT